MEKTPRPQTTKRALVLTSVVAAIVLAGVVLFFLFGDIAEPLLRPTTTTVQ